MAERVLIGRGQVTIQDYTDSKTLLAYIDSTLQRQVIYNPDEGTYSPNYREAPIELVAELYVAGNTNNKIGSAEELTWYVQEGSMGEFEEVRNDDVYSITEDSLIIKDNVLKNNPSMTYQVRIIYPVEDSEGNKEEMVVIASMELVKINSGSKGEDAHVSVLSLPDGDTIRNHANDLRIEVNLHRGEETIKPEVYRWYQLDPTAEGDGVSGPGWKPLTGDTGTLVVTPEMFSGTGTYLSVITYKDKHYRNTTTVKDIVDTTVSIVGPNTFRNGEGTLVLTAKVYSVGEEVDIFGEEYEYKWSSYDTRGNLVDDFNKTGKKIEINADEVDSIISLQCIVVKPKE